jgi:hypothetical protein
LQPAASFRSRVRGSKHGHPAAFVGDDTSQPSIDQPQLQLDGVPVWTIAFVTSSLMSRHGTSPDANG